MKLRVTVKVETDNPEVPGGERVVEVTEGPGDKPLTQAEVEKFLADFAAMAGAEREQ